MLGRPCIPAMNPCGCGGQFFLTRCWILVIDVMFRGFVFYVHGRHGSVVFRSQNVFPGFSPALASRDERPVLLFSGRGCGELWDFFLEYSVGFTRAPIGA